MVEFISISSSLSSKWDGECVWMFVSIFLSFWVVLLLDCLLGKFEEWLAEKSELFPIIFFELSSSFESELTLLSTDV